MKLSHTGVQLVFACCLRYVTGAGLFSDADGSESTGGRLELAAYKRNLYDRLAGLGTVYPGDLDCGVELPCCWKNGRPKVDRLEFVVLDAAAFNEAIDFGQWFGTQVTPHRQFFFVGGRGHGPKSEAVLVSCPIVCAAAPVTISFHHWLTPGATLHVCIRGAFSNHPGLQPQVGCVPVDAAAASPGPARLLLPPGEAFEIMLVANGFGGTRPEFVLIDNISVDFEPCPNEPVVVRPSPVVPSGPSPCCLQYLVECVRGFITDERCCDLSVPDPAEGDIDVKRREFDVTSGRLGTRLTGCKGTPGDEFYLGVLFDGVAGEQAVQKLSGFALAAASVVRFWRWVGTSGTVFEVWCGGQRVYVYPEEGDGVTVHDQSWIQAEALCDAGTDAIEFRCSMRGKNKGGCCLWNPEIFTGKQVVNTCPDKEPFGARSLRHRLLR